MTQPNAKYSVGDRVKVKTKLGASPFENNIGTIISSEYGYRMDYSGMAVTCWWYLLNIASDVTFSEYVLHPLPPEIVISWEECIWQPKDLKVKIND